MVERLLRGAVTVKRENEGRRRAGRRVPRGAVTVKK